jgi:hypothetical protein
LLVRAEDGAELEVRPEHLEVLDRPSGPELARLAAQVVVVAVRGRRRARLAVA